jgi:hypothetical protein
MKLWRTGLLGETTMITAEYLRQQKNNEGQPRIRVALVHLIRTWVRL